MKTILVVDDEQELTDTWVSFLKLGGFAEVVGAYKPDAAMKLIEERKPDLLIVDHNLKARQNGFDVYLKAKEVNPQLKVIMVSGNADDPEVIEGCEKLGIPILLDKPVRVQILLDHVKKNLE